MFKFKQALLILCSTLIIAAGCKSEYEQLRESNDVSKKYQAALNYYNKKDYERALTLFEDLVQKYRGRAEAEDLYYYFSYTNYYLKDYLSARYHFKTFADTYPNSRFAEEARYMAAYCYYLDSPVYSLDQENTYKAIESLQLFINLYPKSERVQEATKLIENLRNKLETKSYANAKLYYDIGDYKSAVIAFRNSLRDFPDTKYAEEMEFHIVKSQYLYAKNSLEEKQEERFAETIDEANSFLEKYPQSTYLKEVEDYKKLAQKGVEEVKNYFKSLANTTNTNKDEH